MMYFKTIKVIDKIIVINIVSIKFRSDLTLKFLDVLIRTYQLSSFTPSQTTKQTTRLVLFSVWRSQRL